MRAERLKLEVETELLLQRSTIEPPRLLFYGVGAAVGVVAAIVGVAKFTAG